MMNHEDDLTPLMQGATQMHEMYESYVEAGFTEEQSMQIILAMVTKMTPAVELPRDNP